MSICIMYIFVLICLVLGLTQTRGLLEHGIGRKNYGKTRLAVDEKWMEMPVDHFNSSDARTWKMRYFEDSSHWKPSGPIVIEINGEGEAQPEFLNISIKLTKETHGVLFGTEHRYYGKSIPVRVDNVSDLKYLSSRQALADVAYFVKKIKEDAKYEKAKVVAVGGSYAGNLASWTRVLYSDVFDAALALSAPVLAKVDFSEGPEKVTEDIRKYGKPGCADELHKRLQYADELMKTNMTGFKARYLICEESDMTRPENLYLFFFFHSSIINFWGICQFGPFYIMPLLCNSLPRSHHVFYKPMFSDSHQIDFWNEDINCNLIDFEKTIIKIAPGMNLNILSWQYQTCTEFGYFIVTTTDQAFIDLPIEYAIKLCLETFGITEETLRRNIENTNKVYGGRNPNVTRVVYINGDADPWSTLGVLADLSPDAPARIVPNGTHCDDGPWQRFETETIKKWIA